MSWPNGQHTGLFLRSPRSGGSPGAIECSSSSSFCRFGRPSSIPGVGILIFYFFNFGVDFATTPRLVAHHGESGDDNYQWRWSRLDFFLLNDVLGLDGLDLGCFLELISRRDGSLN